MVPTVTLAFGYKPFEEMIVVDALSELLALPEGEKDSRGLLHTPAEIAQQPDSWRSTFDIFRRKQSEIARFLLVGGVLTDSSPKPTVFLIGAGTSDYVGQALTQLLRSCWGCEVLAIPSTDLLTHMDALLIPGKRYLWISFSRSGDSPEGVAVLEQARKLHPDIHHIIVSCNSDGRMIRENRNDPRVLAIYLDEAVNDHGLAMTSSFSNMLIAGQCLAHVRNLEHFENILLQLVDAGKSFLPVAADCAAELSTQSHTKACFVGSGPLRAVAKESALKLLELTAGKILTMSESALGLRHGPMAALDQNTLFVCFLSSDQRVRRYEYDLLEEIGQKRLVGSRLAVTTGPGPHSKDLAERHLQITTTIADEYRSPVDVIFGQLLGLFGSLQSKLRPDCPSPNGAISRVVHEFSIHS